MPDRYISLFWRLFIPNATVLGVACIALMVQPPQGRVPVLVAGLAVLVAVNLLLIRRSVEPLSRLTELMGHVDPLVPAQRIPVESPASEVTRLAEAFNAMLDRLEGERSASGRRALAEVEAERRRIAAELHDQIGQSLTAIALHLDRLSSDDGEVLGEIRDAVLSTVEDVRVLARQLRPEALDVLGLVPAITTMLEQLAHQTGHRIVRDLDRDLPALEHDAELVIYRVAQEGCTNAIRHAGAHEIAVELHGGGAGVTLTVCDDGVGLDDAALPGAGIRSMRERAVAVGARLTLRRREPSGTEIRLDVPLEAG